MASDHVSEVDGWKFLDVSFVGCSLEVKKTIFHGTTIRFILPMTLDIPTCNFLDQHG